MNNSVIRAKTITFSHCFYELARLFVFLAENAARLWERYARRMIGHIKDSFGE